MLENREDIEPICLYLSDDEWDVLITLNARLEETNLTQNERLVIAEILQQLQENS